MFHQMKCAKFEAVIHAPNGDDLVVASMLPAMGNLAGTLGPRVRYPYT
jgi:hypothetical protein